MARADMVSGYGDREREFLDSLEDDTGRSLEQWMAAIGAQGLTQRNDIIDWLRRQGFRFSRASWLERVYHNGGQPIYAGRASAARPPSRRTGPVPRPAPVASAKGGALGARPLSAGQPVTPEPTVQGLRQPAAAAYATTAGPSPVAEGGSWPPDVAMLISKAKAYRPLAEFLLRDIMRHVPGVAFSTRGQQVVISGNRGEFAALGVSARELKLALPGGNTALTDARQVNDDLVARIKAAAGAA